MFTEKNMHEVEEFIKIEKHAMDINTFATISGIRGIQFDKEIFTTVIKFKDLRDFIEAFNDVQRHIITSKVKSIRNYVLSGLEKENPMRFFPAITTTARGHIFYDEANNRLAIDTKKSKLSINDGQHRFFGISEAIRQLEGRINKSKDEEEKAKLKATLKQLNEMVMPIVIFNNLSEAEEKQLFHDTNNLAQRPSRSATIRLAQTDLFAHMARELAEENRYLCHFGVEMDKASIFGKNTNTILLTTIYESVKKLLNGKLEEETFAVSKKFLHDTLDKMFQRLPADLNNKGVYIFDQAYTMKGITKFIADYRSARYSEKTIFDAIEKVNWNADFNYWKKFGAIQSKRGKLVFGGSGDHGRYAVIRALEEQLPIEKAVQMELIE
jgi:DNA sulfur modification protein DndB